MKKLIAALVAGLFAAVAYTAMADDNAVKTGPMNKPGRAIDDGSVKSGGTPVNKATRAADEQKPATSSSQSKSKKKKKKTTPSTPQQ